MREDIGILYAGVAELADALDLGSSVPDVKVQVLSPAPKIAPCMSMVLFFVGKTTKDLNARE